MKLIGLTGGIAMGKSTVSKMIQSQGLKVIDADMLAREVVAPGTFGLRALVEVFGPSIVKSGELDRASLGEILFSDEQKKRVIENTTHPLIQWRARQEIEQCRKRGESVCFYDAALLFEKNLTGQFDKILLIHTTPEIQAQRLSHRNRLSNEDVNKIVASQMPISEKIKKADFVVDNSGSLSETEAQLKKVLKEILT